MSPASTKSLTEGITALKATAQLVTTASTGPPHTTAEHTPALRVTAVRKAYRTRTHRRTPPCILLRTQPLLMTRIEANLPIPTLAATAEVVRQASTTRPPTVQAATPARAIQDILVTTRRITTIMDTTTTADPITAQMGRRDRTTAARAPPRTLTKSPEVRRR